MNKFLPLVILVLLLSSCSKVYETNDGAFYVKWNGLYKLEDKSMYHVRDLTDETFIPGETLTSDITIYDAIEVNVKMKVLSSNLLYKMYISTKNGPNSDDMTYLEDLTESSYLNNTISIRTRDKDGFLLSEINLDLAESPVRTQDEKGIHVGYSYEGNVPVSGEIAQSISYIDYLWSLDSP